MRDFVPGDWVERDRNSKSTDIKLVVAVRGRDIWYVNKLTDDGKAPTIVGPMQKHELHLITGCKGFDDIEKVALVGQDDFVAIHNGRTMMRVNEERRAKGDRIRIRCRIPHDLPPLLVRVTYVDDDYICFEILDDFR